MGPPGAGKGTQAKVDRRAARRSRRSRPATSSAANVSEETELGLEAKRYMDAGDYVPDEVTNAMVRDRIAEADAADGFLLDGYPRTRGPGRRARRDARRRRATASTPSWC